MITIHQSLLFAARGGNVDLMLERIEAGADVPHSDQQHGSALLAAIAGHHLSAVELLLSRRDVGIRVSEG